MPCGNCRAALPAAHPGTSRFERTSARASRPPAAGRTMTGLRSRAPVMRVEHAGRTRYCGSSDRTTHRRNPRPVVLRHERRLRVCGHCPHPGPSTAARGVRRDAALRPRYATAAGMTPGRPTPEGRCGGSRRARRPLRAVRLRRPTPLDAVRRYNLFCGGGAMPPRWGLGFLAPRELQAQRQPGACRGRGVTASAGMPCDVIGLEPGWHSASYPCTFGGARTVSTKPARFVKALLRRGFPREPLGSTPTSRPRLASTKASCRTQAPTRCGRHCA